MNIKSTKFDRRIALKGILAHLRMSGIANNYNSLADALHALNMWEFIFNETEVKAQYYATTRYLYRFLHPSLAKASNRGE